MTYITARPTLGMRRGVSAGRADESLVRVDEAEWADMYGLADPESLMHRVVVERVQPKGDKRVAAYDVQRFVNFFVKAVTGRKFHILTYVNRARRKRKLEDREPIMEDVFEAVSKHSLYVLQESSRDKHMRFLEYVDRRLQVSRKGRAGPRRHEREQLIILATRSGFSEDEISEAWKTSEQEIRDIREGWMK